MNFVYEHLHQIIASIGFILDIIGAILIWRFGLPEFIHRGERRNMYFVGDDFEVDDHMKAMIYDRWSTLGLVSLIFGLVLQLISTWIR